MIRRLFISLISALLLFGLNNKANAQGWFVGGGINVVANSEYGRFGIDTHGGYEFNDHWAIGGFLGESIDDDEYVTVFEIFGRYTPWHNDVIYLDLKGKVESCYGTTVLLGTSIVPSLRFRIAPRWDIYADYGYLGVRFYDGEDAMPIFITSNRDALLGVTFRF